MAKRSKKNNNTNTKSEKVVLFGNGLNRLSFTETEDKKFNWENLIINCSNSEFYRNIKGVPYIYLAETIFGDYNHFNKKEYLYNKLFKNYNTNENRIYEEILKKSNIILTTNYTYEIESTLLKESGQIKPDAFKKLRKTKTDSINKKYLINTYNGIKYMNNDKEVWHIHGELYNPSSVILKSSEYARYLSRIIKYIDDNYKDNKKSLKYNSWIDYFMHGDLHIFGISFNYCDLDLWFLLLRKLSLYPKTKVDFYIMAEDKSKEKDKYNYLKQIGVNVIAINTKSYQFFYQKVVDKI